MNLMFWLVGIPAVAVIRAAARFLKAPEDVIAPRAPAPQVVPLWKRKPIIIKEWP